MTPGQVVRIQWAVQFPDVDLSMCETEILLSLDGGKTVYMFIMSSRRPQIQYFDWTVPEYAHECSGVGYSLRVPEYLPGNFKPSASLPFCYRSGGELLIFTSSVRQREIKFLFG